MVREPLAAEVGLARACSRWTIVPMAPSRTRIRSRSSAGRRSIRVARVNGVWIVRVGIGRRVYAGILARPKAT